MSILEKAMKFAFKKHDGQLDDEGKPYVFHVMEVEAILMRVTNDEEVLAAGLLHDTLEDTETTYDELVKEFGVRVADLVNEVTHEGKKDTKGYYFPRLKTQEGIMIKFADRLHNLSRMQSWPEDRKKQYLKKSKFWRSE